MLSHFIKDKKVHPGILRISKVSSVSPMCPLDPRRIPVSPMYPLYCRRILCITNVSRIRESSMGFRIRDTSGIQGIHRGYQDTSAIPGYRDTGIRFFPLGCSYSNRIEIFSFSSKYTKCLLSKRV